MTYSTNHSYTLTSNRETGPAIDTKVACLKRAATYPERPATIDVVETHMSWIFLTPRHAYKLKKPARTDFLDFSTREARRRDCLEELRLNRRLAPDVYLGVVPLVVASSGAIQLERPGDVIDWLVKMRRLPAERMLDYLIRHDALKDAEITQVATLLTRFYQTRPPISVSEKQYRARLEETISGNYRALAHREYGFDPSLLKAINDTLLDFLDSNARVLDTRAEKIVEGHGDLRPEHICLEPRPVIFDCLEFNRRFRIMDIADELAFLDMECERLDAPHVGEALFRTYSQLSHDHPPRSLLLFYKAKSACLRAKLAMWHIQDGEEPRQQHWRDRATQYLELAARYTRDRLQ